MAFWKPGTAGPGVDRSDELEHVAAVYNPSARQPISRQRRFLPIFQSRSEVLFCLEKYKTLVIVGETGSGKTTQIPQYLHEAGWTAGGRRVCCTQPRRVAATSVAARVAEEVGCPLGREVGYAVRFDTQFDEDATRILYMTDGHLVREMMRDPLLSRYSVVVLDEAHERNAQTDILMGLLVKIRAKRPDLRVIVSSATLQADAFKRFFETNTTGDPSRDTVCILPVSGRQHAVDILYLERPVSDFVEHCIRTVLSIHEHEPEGDVLVFLPGEDEITDTCRQLRDRLQDSRNRAPFVVFPLHASLPYRDQLRAFEPPRRGTRKIICATNIAETSVTIDGIVYVVDSMFVKLPMYNARTGLESLVIQPVTQASATQRAGRAGRVQAGKCYRLCTEESFKELRPFNVPELQRTALHGAVLQLKALGVANVLRFPFPSPPPAEALSRAYELLYALGCVDDTGQLTTPLGMSLAEFPVEPRIGKMLLASFEFGCTEEALTVAAMLGVKHVFISGRTKTQKQEVELAMRGFASREGDHLTMVNIFNGFAESKYSSAWCQQNMVSFRALRRAAEVRRQLRGYAKLFGPKGAPLESCTDDSIALRKCIVSGFFSNAARLLPSGKYATVRDGREVAVHPSSVVYKFGHVPEWVVFHDIQLTTDEFIREITEIDPRWLLELAPHFYETRRRQAATRADLRAAMQHFPDEEM